MNKVIELSIVVLAAGAALSLLDKIIVQGGIAKTAKTCLGLVYLSTVVKYIAVLLFEWGG